MLMIKIGRESKEQNNKEVESALTQFVELKAEEKKLKEQIANLQPILSEFGKKELKDSDTSTITLSVGDDAIQIKYDYDVKVKDDDTLKKLLGERYKDLVAIKTEVKPVAKLKEMALEDDGLKACLDIKEKKPAVSVK